MAKRYEACGDVKLPLNVSNRKQDRFSLSLKPLRIKIQIDCLSVKNSTACVFSLIVAVES